MTRDEFDALPAALDVEAVARLLGIGRTTAFSHVNQGAIPSFRIGKRLKVPKHSIEGLLYPPTES